MIFCPRCTTAVRPLEVGPFDICPACRQTIGTASEGAPRQGQLAEPGRGGCGRCGRDIDRAPEFCWYCLGDLCYPCWDEVGHCGHPEADEANRKAREWKPGDAEGSTWMTAPWRLKEINDRKRRRG